MKKVLKTIIIFFIIITIVVIIFKAKIKRINVKGNTKYDDAELITKVFDGNWDRISIILFTKEKFRKHKNIIYLEKYDIKFKSPFEIDLIVYEKEPIAFVKNDIKNVYFDKDGIVDDITEERKEGIPEIRGVNFKNFEKGEKLIVGDKVLLDVILNIAMTMKSYNLSYELLEFEKNNEITIYCDNIQVLLGDIRNMEVKLLRLKDIYPKIKDLSGTLDLKNAKDNMLDEKYIFKKSN